jgi:hypothetical protein
LAEFNLTLFKDQWKVEFIDNPRFPCDGRVKMNYPRPTREPPPQTLQGIALPIPIEPRAPNIPLERKTPPSALPPDVPVPKSESQNVQDSEQTVGAILDLYNTRWC